MKQMNQLLLQSAQEDSKLEGKSALILAYSKLKSKYDEINHQSTLQKYRILSEAFRLGKKIYGMRKFSLDKLAKDFEMPRTTVKRIMSLSKANLNTKRLMKEGKISAFKAASVLMSRNSHYQDELISLVIKNNLSTYDIRKLRLSKFKDLRQLKQMTAIKQGYSRKDSAFIAFNYALVRFNNFLKMNPSDLPNTRLPLIKTKLQEVKKSIQSFEGKLK